MRTSHYRRESKWPSWLSGKRRIVAAVATLVAFGGIVTVTQVSNASTTKQNRQALAACDNIQAPKSSKLSTKTKQGTYTTNNGKVTQHSDDGASDVPSVETMRTRCRQWVLQNVSTKADNGKNNNGKNNNGGKNNGGQQNNNGGQQNNNNGGQNNGGQQQQTPAPGAGLGVLANNCDKTKLQLHDGFQKGDRCVTTEFGEVGSAANNPSLLITQAPTNVGVNQPFTLKVSTRNLIRDRFLAAGQGGYYVESSVLQGGIVRGHFHTACRMLNSTSEAPAPDPVPAFFVATEDQKGGRAPDVVTIQVPGLPSQGVAQCASWAGDGSHRIPMMERANQTPAFDTARITVGGRGGNNNGGNNNGGGNNGGGNKNQNANQNQNQNNNQAGDAQNKQRDAQNKQRDAQNQQESQNKNRNK